MENEEIKKEEEVLVEAPVEKSAVVEEEVVA
jgi:hypothetical protein